MKVLFRLIIGIPVYLIAYAMNIVAQIAAVIAWFAIVITGKEPEGIYQMLRLGLSYQHRAMPYGLLLTEDWPEFTQEADRAALQPGGAGDGTLTPLTAAPEPAAAESAPQAPRTRPTSASSTRPRRRPAPRAEPPRVSRRRRVVVARRRTRCGRRRTEPPWSSSSRTSSCRWRYGVVGREVEVVVTVVRRGRRRSWSSPTSSSAPACRRRVTGSDVSPIGCETSVLAA